jgi:pyruvate formate lyase activating enzyme
LLSCKNNAIKPNGQTICIDRKLCNNCGNCAEVCPTKAINVFGELMTVQQVMKIVEKESVFYTRSRGGLTLSGGEATAQVEFTKALLEEAKKRRINTAIETCGYTQWENIESIKDSLDLIYYDIKCLDREKHIEFTSVSNELILDNLKRLFSNCDKNKIIVRTPVVPGFNDNERDLVDIADFLKGMGSTRFELLRYHRFGASKYEHLGKEYPMGNEELSSQRFEELENAIKKCMQKN